MSYQIITGQGWQGSEREMFQQQLNQEIVIAADLIWQLQTSLLLLDAAEKWREEPGSEGEILDAMEFFLSTWLRQHRPKVEEIHRAVDAAYMLSCKLAKGGAQSCKLQTR